MANEKTKIIGESGAVTGFETPDPKDSSPHTINTTTPAEDRVGAADSSKYEPVVVPDAKATTGQFDHLATRDPVAMEQRLQRPEYEGAESTVALGASTTMVGAVVPADGMGSAMSTGIIDQHIHSAVDQNPNYTPPSKMAPPHISEQVANRPGDENVVIETPLNDTTKR